MYTEKRQRQATQVSDVSCQAGNIESQVPLPREPSCQPYFCLFKNFVFETITDMTDGSKYSF